ncbi:hypothetical protein ESCO_006811 [Escovopsis weberi]|uniref:Asteroid domain-containing protein n=1 Tax=Escovopsis weberi TaxID=150374 RepID=A0A0M8N629_ESCWE|nr:hypothetical protein ESCO_006811 [Escovopsis weberi]
MERMMKSNSRIVEFFNSNPKGSVIDAVRSSPRYRDRFSVVPGEADAFCARHVAQDGGTVMTSDSDLLAHDLGNGKVVFLREIHRTAEGQLSCLIFNPREIHGRIGLPASVEPWRFAYERKHSPNATLSRLVSACSLPVVDAVGYDEFRQQYLHRQGAGALPSLVASGGATPLRLDGLDPRLSELILQLGPDAADASIFLSALIENPLRGTVWEPSMSTRRLAYSIAGWLTGCPPSLPVYEFRRVRQRSQKGRQLTLIHPDDIAATISSSILAIRRSTRKSAGDADPRHWIILSFLLDVAGCEEQGKASHLLETLRKGYTPSPKSAGRLPWDIAHFAAQVQASLYSLRILAQVLGLLPRDCEGAFGGSLWQLRGLLSRFPSLLWERTPRTTKSPARHEK